MINGHGGNIYSLAERLDCNPAEIIDMSSNVNPVGPMPELLDFLKDNIDVISFLPEVDSGKLVNAFATRYDISPETVIAGNGTTQFIYTIPQAIKTKKALIFGPTYADYADACKMHGVAYEYFSAVESDGFKHNLNRIKPEINGFDTVFICNPNNPTGNLIPAAELVPFIKKSRDTIFIVDESYMPFVKRSGTESLINYDLDNLILLNSMSKIFRIPGLRIGFLICSLKTMSSLLHYQLPWSVNSIAQAAVLFLMEHQNKTDHFIDMTQKFLEKEKKLFFERITKPGMIKPFPSVTSFFMARLYGNLTADMICRNLSESRMLIRNCSNFEGLSDRFIRISLKTSRINRLLAEKLSGLNGKKNLL